MAALMRAALACLFLGVGGSPLAHAADTTLASLRLISERAGLGSEPTLWAGVNLTVPAGWKLYWRSVGVSGRPPLLDWSGSENVAEIQVYWPAPEVMAMADAGDGAAAWIAGYRGDVVLPLSLRPIDAAQAGSLRLAARWALCRDVCVAEQGEARLTLPAGSAGFTAHAGTIRAAISRTPALTPRTILVINEARLLGPDIVKITGQGAPPSGPFHVLVELGGRLPVSLPNVWSTAPSETAILAGPWPEGGAAPAAGTPLTLTVLAEGHAQETRVVVEDPGAEPAAAIADGPPPALGAGDGLATVPAALDRIVPSR